MHCLHPDSFFELDLFEHGEIFDGCAYVWEALSKIKLYLEKKKLGKIAVSIPKTAHLVDSNLISIGEGTSVEAGAYIKGPCIIGKHCVIRQGAYLRGRVIAGDNCVLGHGSEFKNAILFNGAHAAHFAYVGDSILGNRVNLGAGTVCANLRLDKGVVEVLIRGERINTGLRKFGAIFGDDAQTGCNAASNPGALLGKGAFCYPCVNFGGFVSAATAVRQDVKVVYESGKKSF